MTLNDFRAGWRSLAQEPVYALVVIASLAVGLATALLLLGYVHYSWQYNAQVPQVEQVYVVKQRFNIDPHAPWFDQAPLFLRSVASTAPGVTLATGYIPSRPQASGMVVATGTQLQTLQSLHGLTVLPGFAEVLGLQALEGQLQAALEQPDSIALTEAAAVRLFGTPHCIARTLQVEGHLLRVAAVLPTPPANTTIPYEALIGVNSSVMESGFRDELLTGKQGWWGKLLVRLQPGASTAAVEALMQQAIDSNPALQAQTTQIKSRLGARKAMDIQLAPLRAAYFDQDIASNYISPAGERAHPSVVLGLGAVALLILLLASINYVNLATVAILRRQREVAMRKVLGAQMTQIVLRMLAESLMVTMTATLLGLLLAWLALPLFASLVQRQLDGLLTPGHILAALALGALLGVLTAIYPALIAILIRPSTVLAGRADTESQGSLQLRRAMTVLQLATAMGFASVTLAVLWQTQYALRASPGFDPTPLLIVDLLDEDKDRGRMPGLIAALAAQPGVEGVAISQDAVGRHLSTWQRDLQRTENGSTKDGSTRQGSTSAEIKWVSANFFQQYQLQAVAGRLFDARLDQENDPLPLVINAAAARELGFATPNAAIGQTLYFTDDDQRIPKRVIGIAPELRFHSMREAQPAQRAIAYELSTRGHTLSIRYRGPAAAVEQAVRTQWPRYFPDAILSMRQASDILADDYANDARMAKLLAISTGIALTIAAFGSYVLSAYSVQRRAQEIVLRKLHGAGSRAIALLIGRETMVLTLVSALIGLPVAALAIARYLAGYTEQAPAVYGTLLVALAATLVVASLAAGRHVWLAMRMKPALAIRG